MRYGDASDGILCKGYHIYQELWEAVIGDELQCQRERDNPADNYAVAVRKGRTVVGHLPRRLSRHCALFIPRGGTIHCSPTGKRSDSNVRTVIVHH